MEGGVCSVNIECCPYLILLDELQAVGVQQVVGKTLNLVLKQKEYDKTWFYMIIIFALSSYETLLFRF